MKTKIRICKKTGNVKILDVEGGGAQCIAMTANFERDLGIAKENTRVHTSSYEEPVTDPEILTVEEDG